MKFTHRLIYAIGRGKDCALIKSAGKTVARYKRAIKEMIMPDNNEYRITLNFGSNVISNMSGVLTLEGENQISLETGDNGQPLLTMNIYNTKGRKIAKINRNRWMFNEKDRFETVINASSLKLTDTVSGHCLIEINLLDKNIMQIPHGKFYTHYGQLVEVTSSLYRIEGVEVKNNIIDACGKAFVVA